MPSGDTYDRGSAIATVIQSDSAVSSPGWQARLDLGLARTGPRTVLRDYGHEGPLYVQRALYPERDGCAHLYLLHPPGGLVQGDRIEINVTAARGAHTLLTTPSAAKLYRTPAGGTHQQATIRVADDASVEWLPQEAIIFEGAVGHMQLDFELCAGARLIAWDAFALGRPASGEAFEHGLYDNRLSLRIDGRLHWHERTRVPGRSESHLQTARWGMGAYRVLGTLVAYVPEGINNPLADTLRDALREMDTPIGVTCVDGVLIVRILSVDTARLHQALHTAWATLRPVILGKQAVAPRIWAT